MIGTYGSSLNRPHTEEDVLKARQALTLLKAHKAKGETAARMLGACIVKNNELKKANSTTYSQLNNKQENNKYRRIFSQLNEDDIEEKKHSYTPTVAPVRNRLDKVNQKYNITSIPQDHKPMSNLAKLGKNSMGIKKDSANDEFNMKPPIKSVFKKPTQPSPYYPKEFAHYDNEVKENEYEEDRPIRQDNNFDNEIPEQGTDLFSIEKCRYCQRSFNMTSLIKHENVCQNRPNKKKRKVFDSKKARIVDEEQKKLESGSTEAKLPAKKIPKWKLQSAQFRKAIKSTKTEGEQAQAPDAADEMDERSLYVQCQTCGRSFNEEAAKRHVPFCANKAKLDAIKNGGKLKPQPTKPQSLVQNKYGKRK